MVEWLCRSPKCGLRGSLRWLRRPKRELGVLKGGFPKADGVEEDLWGGWRTWREVKNKVAISQSVQINDIKPRDENFL